MSDFHVVEGGPEHLERALAITRLTFQAHAARQPDWFPDTVLKSLESSFRASVGLGTTDGAGRLLLYVGVCDGHQAGHALCRVDERVLGPGQHDRIALLMDISVADEFRGQGLGRALLRRTTGALLAEGVTLVTATVWAGNTASLRMLDATGFLPVFEVRSLRLAPARPGRPGGAKGKPRWLSLLTDHPWLWIVVGALLIYLLDWWDSTLP